MNLEELVIIEGHNSSYHDGGVAVYDGGKIVALVAERADRIKHSMDSSAAYAFLKKRLDLRGKRVYDFF